MTRLEYQKSLNKFLSIGPSVSFLELNNGNQFYNQFIEANLNMRFNLLPEDDLSPYLYGGGGVLIEAGESVTQSLNTSGTFYKAQYGGGLQWSLSKNFGLNLFAEHNMVFSDELDNRVNGKRDDFYFNFGLGLNFYFSK